MQRVLVALAVFAGLTSAAPAHAQLPGRIRIVVDGGAQMPPTSFGQSFTLTKNAESAPVTTTLKPATGSFFDAGVRVRLVGPIGVGVVGFSASSTANGSLDARIPHPFFFNQLRPISGTLSGVERTETGAHMELDYTIAVSKFDITLFGGPSYISLQQALVTDVTYTEAYPFDTATFASALSTKAKKSGTGFNGGADVTWRLGKSFGLAGLVRYTGGTLSLEAAADNTADVKAGGVQVGGGLRIIF